MYFEVSEHLFLENVSFQKAFHILCQSPILASPIRNYRNSSPVTAYGTCGDVNCNIQQLMIFQNQYCTRYLWHLFYYIWRNGISSIRLKYLKTETFFSGIISKWGWNIPFGLSQTICHTIFDNNFDLQFASASCKRLSCSAEMWNTTSSNWNPP